MILTIFEVLKNTMENYLQELNIKQREAVKHLKGPLMVIAGAGSGKTRVLTYRVVNLLKSGINPHHILSLTFTNKAAKEMRNRIEEITGESEARSLWMGTFHSVFSRILRFEAENLNYPSNFTIYDTDDSKSLVRSIIKELNLDKDIYKAGIIRTRISALKNNLITPAVYKNKTELLETDKIAKRSEFARIYQIYNNRCEKASAMDFDDLLLKTYQLFENYPHILLRYQEKFQYILIDEYQDTNHIQYLIIKKLAALYKNICIVGDDAQSIYAFRGANIQNILNFKLDYPDYKTYKLEQNYRSTSTIVKAANSIIKHNEKQIKKSIWTKNAEGDKIIICKTGSDNDEGRLVANTISDVQMRKQAHHKEFAILYRTNAQSRPLEESLRKRNLPYKIYGGLSFYQRKEIKDLLAYYRLAINPNDEEAFKRVINYPTRGIGATTIQRLNVFANDNKKSIWEIINSLQQIKININTGTKNKLRDFALMINNYSIKARKEDAYTIAEEIAKSTGLFNSLYNDKSPEGVSRFENIQELLNGIKDFSDTTEKGLNKLSDFMHDVALLTDQDIDNKDDFNKVTLMTVHAAKGLEFPYVFVVGLEENLFPSMMSGESQENLEEERRLFYVAITRAKKRIFLSFSTSRFRWGQFIDCEASRFLSELDDSFVEKHEVIPKTKKEFSPHKIYAKTKLKKKEYSAATKKFIPTNNLTNINRAKNISIHISDLSRIENGMQVKHARFGKGKVLAISGDGANKKATVFFNGIGQKQLLLRFAKLELIK
ncbi:UvrD-helicase domain-containing protein [Flavobacteriales bacterium]|nr:UvrD-helicase domain-containing protein [Flavobacteriales bacterium]